jgi:hypothetical protein
MDFFSSSLCVSGSFIFLPGGDIEWFHRKYNDAGREMLLFLETP